MATSTFVKTFSVDKRDGKKFVEVMTRPATPTLNKNFQTRLVHISKDSELRSKLLEALGKR